MPARRKTLGRRLSLYMGITTGVGLLFCAFLTVVVWWWSGEDKQAVGPAEETASQELAEDVLVALAVATPVGILSTVLAARWVTSRATRRIDEVIATASRINARDMTSRLPIATEQDELNELSASINQMLDRINRGIAAQRQFAADASHELRTPLASMQATLDVALTRDRSSSDWKSLASQVHADVQDLTRLVTALATLARVDGALGQRTSQSLQTLVQGVAKQLEAVASPRGVSIAVASSKHRVAMVDEAEMKIAVSNLIRNAIEHSPPGGVIDVAVNGDDNYVSITVSDQGPGVPLQDRVRIFAPFARGNTSADRGQHQGLGLGLPLAQRIAESYGGTIDVGDSETKGARFELRFPATT
jgi:two-component system, OmpR family, sensor kinase